MIRSRCFILFLYFFGTLSATEKTPVVFSASDYITFPTAEILNEHTARIPFKLVDRLMVIEAGLLDKTGNFIIDTGSETLLLNSIHFTEPYIQKKKDGHGVLTSIDGILERRILNFHWIISVYRIRPLMYSTFLILKKVKKFMY